MAQHAAQTGSTALPATGNLVEFGQGAIAGVQRCVGQHNQVQQAEVTRRRQHDLRSAGDSQPPNVVVRDRMGVSADQQPRTLRTPIKAVDSREHRQLSW